MQMDYQKAVDNLMAILRDEEQFSDINKSVFDAIDTDNSGTLEKQEVEVFVKGLLKGVSDDKDEDFEEKHKMVFSVLDENESGEITLDELGKFLRELFKEQIKTLNAMI